MDVVFDLYTQSHGPHRMHLNNTVNIGHRRRKDKFDFFVFFFRSSIFLNSQCLSLSCCVCVCVSVSLKYPIVPFTFSHKNRKIMKMDLNGSRATHYRDAQQLTEWWWTLNCWTNKKFNSNCIRATESKINTKRNHSHNIRTHTQGTNGRTQPASLPYRCMCGCGLPLRPVVR